MRFFAAFMLAVAAVPCAISAQDDRAVPAPASPGPVQAADGTFVIPRLTPVMVQIVDPVGSLSSKSLDIFRIRLAEPIMFDGKVLVPAGITGKGEVVHAKKAGGSGAPGELVLAARYLDVDGRQLRLRSMHVTPSGLSKIRTVNEINIAAAATVPAVALVGFFMKGGEVDVPAGALAEARIAQDFAIAGPVDGPENVLPAAGGSAAQDSGKPQPTKLQPEGKQDNEDK